MIPNATETFKPRAHASALSNAVQDAWRQYQEQISPQTERDRIAALIIAHIESAIPAADLATLRRFGFTRKTTYVSVRAHNGIDWRESFGVDLPREIENIDRNFSLYASGPRLSQQVYCGYKEEAWNALPLTERDNIREHHARTDLHTLPPTCDAYFTALVEARQHYRAEYRAAVDWPAEYKAQHGTYPPWQVIADQFHVLGAYLRQQWSA